MRTLGDQGFPAISAKNSLIFLVGLLSVRDRNFSHHALQLFPLVWIFGSLKFGVDNGINQGVNAADEEAGHAGDPAHVAAGRSEFLQTGDVGLRHFYVNVLREQ